MDKGKTKLRQRSHEQKDPNAQTVDQAPIIPMPILISLTKGIRNKESPKSRTLGKETDKLEALGR
jgi:hypothetical protein